MKKYTLIPTLISAVALAVPAFADDLLPSLVDDEGNSNVGQVVASSTGWSNTIGSPDNITADVVGNNYGTGLISDTGWYWGMANLQSGESYDLVDVTSTGFTYAGRQAYGGEFVLATVDLSDLLGDTGELLTSFTISFNMQSNSSEGFHIYCVNTTTNAAVEFSSSADLVSGPYTYTWTAESEDYYLSDEYALIFIWNGYSYGTSVTVSDLSSSYVTTPEPELFSIFFGLGAIGLVATRRRKRVA